MRVGDRAIYYPAMECDQGIMAEEDRVGCAAICVHQHQNGQVNLIVWDHEGNGRRCLQVDVHYPPEFVPPCPPEDVDPPHRTPYCRPVKSTHNLDTARER